MAKNPNRAKYQISIRRRLCPAATLAEARRLWRAKGSKSARRVSEGDGNVYDESGALVNIISFNGRIWTPEEDWQARTEVIVPEDDLPPPTSAGPARRPSSRARPKGD
jgi:hypothetical protein